MSGNGFAYAGRVGTGGIVVIGGVTTDVESDAVGRTVVVSAEAAGEAAGAFVSMIKVEQVNS